MEEDATGFDPNIWKQISDFGWAGLLIPDEFGGSGGDLTDMVSLYEEIGRAILPSPLFASGVEAATAVVLAAECVGGAERSLELAVDYSKRRIAFGRPIGAFQALQHKMARMVTEMIGSQLTVYEAAYKLSNGEDASLEVPIAKAAA